MSSGHTKQKKSSSTMNNVKEPKIATSMDPQEKSASITIERKSVEDLLSGSHDSIGNSLSFTSGSILESSPVPVRRSPSSSIGGSPNNSPRPLSASKKGDHQSQRDDMSYISVADKTDTTEDSISKSSDSSNVTASDGSTSKYASVTTTMTINTSTSSTTATDKPKGTSKVSERAKKKSWYSVLYPSYKSRSEDFKKLFKGVPDDERLVVDYSCAVQRDILVHGRLYVSQNYLCFYANIFRWETCLSIKWKDVTAITKEKTALVIPNAILVSTTNEKYFITSFTSRDKAYLMLFRVWQNALMDKPMQPQEMWQWVHNCYGDQLGLTSDDEDYIDPYENRDEEHSLNNNGKSAADSVSEDHSEPQSDTTGSSNKLTNNTNDEASRTKSKVTAAKADLLQATQPPKVPHRKLINKLMVNRKRGTAGGTDESVPTNPIDQLPTDMSDSSDSENGKNIPFVSTAECDSMHEGRQLVHTILPINVDTLFSLLFSKSKFLVEFHNARKTMNMVHQDWSINEDGLKSRQVTLTVALTQAVGPKCSHVTENQVMRDCSDDGQLYSIDITSTNAGIPYADSFYITMHYCLVRTVDDHTMFSVHTQVKYKKSVWGVVKGFIEKNAWAGLEDFYTALLRALQSEYCIPPAKAKGRRPRRGASSLQRPPDEPAKIPKAPFTTLSVPAKVATGTPVKHPPKYEPMSFFVILVMVALVLLNVILYFKLWNLEESSAQSQTPLFDFRSLKNTPKTQEDWIQILQQQEVLHATETIKWQNILQTAVQLLRKTEQTLTDLLALIHLKESHSPHSQQTGKATADYAESAFMEL